MRKRGYLDDKKEMYVERARYLVNRARQVKDRRWKQLLLQKACDAREKALALESLLERQVR